MPNFSHGAAGIGFALARASMVTDRPDLLDLAARTGHRLVRLGARPDGTLAVPYKIYPPAEPEPGVTYGWCHGPAGTSRLFELLDQLRPGEQWAGHARACRLAVRTSGLPARLRPGFWDNHGQCCGTAGVGERVLDWYGETGDPGWLDWADTLAADLIARASPTTKAPAGQTPSTRPTRPTCRRRSAGCSGAAGIAGFLLRLARTHANGPDAACLPWPDGTSCSNSGPTTLAQ